ncbi:MAG: DUF427 domain-containing protein [Acidimicrobiia bacterium]|nr:DUF427 domain-containing protein [Acidimicrobiia bacterium]
MATATFNGTVIADSDATVVVEGNHYFPPDSVRGEYLSPTEHHTTCPWKGDASYFTIEAGGQQVENGAWTYPQPKGAASEIADHIAFYRSQVEIAG